MKLKPSIEEANRLRTIRLYGKLGAKFGRVHRLAVGSTAEAMRALCILLHGFEAYMMNARDRGMNFAVFLGRRNIGQTELSFPAGDQDIRIAPVMVGAKSILGIVQVIVGVALVVVGAYFGQGWAVALGIGLIVGGVATLLMAMPKDQKSKDDPKNEPNYAFNGPINTQAQGNPVPLLYGEMVVGSAVISAGISSSDSVYIPVAGAFAPTPGPGDDVSDGFGSIPGHDRWEDYYNTGILAP